MENPTSSYCAKCGTTLLATADFCHKCGGRVGTTDDPQALPSGNSEGGGLEAMPHNVACALAYAFGAVTGIVFLILDPYRKDSDIRFHAWQSIFLCIGWFVVNFVIGFLALGLFFIWVLQPLINLTFLVLWIICMVKAYNKERFKLPVVGDLAESQSKKALS